MEKDTITKDFIRDNTIFADVFNQYVYGGRQVILPEQLEERDPSELSLPYGKGQAAVPVQKFRDVRKLYAAKTDGRMNYVLFGVENQSEIHYAMPVRNNLYDALAYAGQAEEAARAHRRERKASENGKARTNQNIKSEAAAERKKPSRGEFLGGFWKEDRLIPVITLTIWWGPGEWDGPLSLFEMMDRMDPEIFSYMNDYRMNLAAPGMMTDEEIMRYQTGLREIMLFIKYSKDREKLLEIMETDRERFEKLEKQAADVIEAVTGSGLKYEEGDETVNMCEAIQEIRQEAYNQGIQNERDNTLKEKKRADEAETRADAAETRADAAETRADEAETRADMAELENIRLREEIQRLQRRLAGG